MLEGIEITAEKQRGILHASSSLVAAGGVFCLLRPWINALAARYTLSGLDQEVIGSALTGAISLTGVGVIHALLFLIVGAPRRARVFAVVTNLRNWLISQRVHWGLRRDADRRTVANTAEGLIAIVRSAHGSAPPSPVERKIARAAVAFLIRSAGSDGLPSVSLRRGTVHCTAMGLYAIAQANRSGRYDVGGRATDAIDGLMRALRTAAHEYGWGFLTQPIQAPAQCRVFSTLWALRALNLTTAVAEPWFTAQYASLLRYVPGGRFGFRYADQPRVAMISLFLINIDELDSVTLRTSIRADFDLHALLREILDDVGSGMWREVEEYEVGPREIGVEKLSWSHTTIALAIEALSLWHKELTMQQRLRLGRLIRQVVRKHIDASSYFIERTKDAGSRDPLMFPASYVITALKRWTEI